MTDPLSHRRMPMLSLLDLRSIGRMPPQSFWSGVASKRADLALSGHCQIASAHLQGIESLHIDQTEGRFLLAGSRDATVSIYDISKWGTDHHLKGKSPSSRPRHCVYSSIARSVADRTDPFVNVQWYPSDSGAFVSASTQGFLSVWDTNVMIPVVHWEPLSSIYCMHLSPSIGRAQNLAAVGAKQGSTTGCKLVDVQSGAISHSLVGHQGGITAVQWSPLSDVVLASGSTDGTIRLWDIRKAGSRSCLTVLDRDRDFDPCNCHPLFSDYHHLKGTKKTSLMSPNNFDRSQTNSVASHAGAITALCFSEDGLSLSSTGTDGKLQVWDLRGNGHRVRLNFQFRVQQPAVTRANHRIPLKVKNYGEDTIAWCGNGSRILGYSLTAGGRPRHVLEGHMLKVSSIESIDSSMQIVSGASDGMMLTWEAKPAKQLTKNGGQRKRSREASHGDRDSW